MPEILTKYLSGNIHFSSKRFSAHLELNFADHGKIAVKNSKKIHEFEKFKEKFLVLHQICIFSESATEEPLNGV